MQRRHAGSVLVTVERGGSHRRVQFKAHGGSYATVKVVNTSQNGWLDPTVTASRTGSWRLVYWGNSAAAASTSTGDTVGVDKWTGLDEAGPCATYRRCSVGDAGFEPATSSV